MADGGRLYFPKMTVLTHFPSHMFFFRYDIDTCPWRGGSLHPLPLNLSRLCNCLDELPLGEEVSQHDFPDYSSVLSFLSQDAHPWDLATTWCCCEEAQTSPHGETREEAHVERNWGPRPPESTNYQIHEWTSLQMIPVFSLCVLRLRPKHTSWSREKSSSMCTVLILDPENPPAE